MTSKCQQMEAHQNHYTFQTSCLMSWRIWKTQCSENIVFLQISLVISFIVLKVMENILGLMQIVKGNSNMMLGFGLLDEKFHDQMNYDAWKKKPFHADGCLSLFPEAKRTVVNPEDPFLDNFRTGTSIDKSFDFSGGFQNSAPLTSDFRQLTAERVNSATNSSANFETTIDPHAWSFTGKEDLHDSFSLFSEESCSSTAVGEERSYEFESQSIGIGSRHSNF
ncbi:uncharacterized protein LOC120273251 [Dioscorea cayenensis subsp. rotundata]|uniref:Uncharacterized protein LOC120273251 n=1 Tax=Dioscorea cayennensis subsp. rotundata TaxID=55577 RepID=A0AB40CAJ8_DIOCR|nr:uncharacterized protein LOC120273251 [Dioscorea cayenensis subsp. rotundata]